MDYLKPRSELRDSLVSFESRVKDAFLAGQIRGPIHLSGGNEDQLIDIFSDIHPDDWVLSTWRNHYHALLKGIPEDWLFDEILHGRSMMIHSSEHRFLTSAIVGGTLPIAVGLGMGIIFSRGSNRVWVFVGDMAAETGNFCEAVKYAGHHNLPIIFVIEDNGLSTNTPTQEAWGVGDHAASKALLSVVESCYMPPSEMAFHHNAKVLHYRYKRRYPHVGVGEWVTFG